MLLAHRAAASLHGWTDLTLKQPFQKRAEGEQQLLFTAEEDKEEGEKRFTGSAETRKFSPEQHGRKKHRRNGSRDGKGELIPNLSLSHSHIHSYTHTRTHIGQEHMHKVHTCMDLYITKSYKYSLSHTHTLV